MQTPAESARVPQAFNSDPLARCAPARVSLGSMKGAGAVEGEGVSGEQPQQPVLRQCCL